MGCSSCGGRARARVLGKDPSMPLIMGTDDPSLPVRPVIFTKPSHGARVGDPRFVRGSEVDSMIVNGILRLAQSSSGV